MKLPGFLKDKVDKADTKEEKKSIIAEAGMELNDEELDSVAGGYPLASFKCCCGTEVTSHGQNYAACRSCGSPFTINFRNNTVTALFGETVVKNVRWWDSSDCDIIK